MSMCWEKLVCALMINRDISLGCLKVHNDHAVCDLASTLVFIFSHSAL